MRRSAAMLLLLVAAPARAQTVDASAMTLAQGRSDPRDGNLYSSAPIYQQVSLLLSDVKLRYVDDLKVVVSGWGELSFMITESQLGATGDLDVGFVEGKLFRRRLTLRLGRQLVYGGGARMLPLDGGSMTLRIIHNISLDAYGGVPVTPKFGVHQGDAAAGVRLYWQPNWESAVGVSFAEMLNDGRQARQDLGFDARYRPHRMVTLSGYALLSLLELRLAEADVAATITPTTSVLLAADYRRTSPDLFLPRSSILSVFSQETRDEAGGNVFWRALPRLRLEGDWHAIVDSYGFGQRGGGRVSASLGPAFETTLALEARVLRLASQNGYAQARIYAIQRLPRRLVLTVDLDGYLLEKPINGHTLSFTSSLTLGWDFLPRWRAVVGVVADTTPLVQRNFECMAKLVYNGSWRLRTVQP